MTVVIDGSALVVATLDSTERGDRVRAQLGDGGVAPFLIDAEMGQAVRGLVLRRKVTTDVAASALVAGDALIVDRFPHRVLRERAWSLRYNVSYYDALYVALAEILRMNLLTTDKKLASAVGPRCEIELV